MRRTATQGSRYSLDRFQVVLIALGIFFLMICAKLFYLQVVQADEYERIAVEQNTRGIELPARRGAIYVTDSRTGEKVAVAQNSTTYTIFADPMLVANEAQIADALAPMLFVPKTEVERQHELSFVAEAKASAAEQQAVLDAAAATAAAQPGAIAPIPTVTPEQEFHDTLLKRLMTKEVLRRTIHNVSPESVNVITQLKLPGVGFEGTTLVLTPLQITDPDGTAVQLATVLELPYPDLLPMMKTQKLRYAKLASRVDARVKEKIEALGIKGVGAIPEYRRVYPEKDLAAQVIGFLGNDGKGTYGIEGAFQKDLAGKNGLRRTQVDPFNRQITAGDVTIEDAENGTDIVLTLDRSIQAELEKHLKTVVDEQRADGGQGIVMDPKTGAILALAHYPTFDPNVYGQVYERVEVPESKIVTEFDRDYVVDNGYRYPVFYDGTQPVLYKNRVGPSALSLKAVNEPFEPGSIFKGVVMAMGVDAGVVTPTTRSTNTGPLELDEKLGDKNIVIKNANNHYYGQETMTEVIGHSSNIGMAFVVMRLGKAVMYDYLKRFGFGDKTDIDLDGETPGRFDNYTTWSKAELITKSFGQGITVNLIQMARAYSAIANGGLLMKPYVVAEKTVNGNPVKTQPEVTRRVMSEETAGAITAMLISSVDNYYAKTSRIPGYYVAGKTGTSQTYGKNGRAFTELGTTIATFAGFAPATDPKFVMITKIDRPRAVQWGETTAGKVFHDTAEYLLRDYYAIPPKRESNATVETRGPSAPTE